MGRRIRWLALVLVLCFVAVLAQLVNIQLRQATSLNSSTKNPRNAAKRFDNARGVILASDGTVLAKSVPAAAPAGAPPYRYKRVYPTGPLYSGIVGYDSPAFYGTSGVEYTYNTYLGVHAQKAQTLGQLLNPPGTTTDNVTTTVIPRLQKLLQQELNAIPDTHKDGAVTVLRVKTSAVLGMYSNPTYTNNALATPTPKKDQAAGQADSRSPDHEGFFAYPPMATYDTFAPGSTFKVVTSSAVYNLKPELENFTFKVAGCTPKPGTPGAIPETNKQICNDATTPTAANPCGGTMVQMLPESCDPGYAELGLAVGGVDLAKQAGLFGFNQTPPVDLNFGPGGVSKSNFPTPAELAPTGTLGTPGVALSAFGQQTVTETDLQNAMVAEGIANGGAVMTPHVMAEIHNATGALVERYKPTLYKQAESAKAATSVNRLMQLVASTPRGTAAGIFPSQWDIAVKTGTAQAGPGNTNTTDWMIGFAPAYDPVVAVSVVVPLQARSASGASIAGPIMRAVMTLALKIVPHHGTPPATTTTTTAPPATFTTTPTTTSPPSTTAPTTTTTTAPPVTTTTTGATPTTVAPGTAAVTTAPGGAIRRGRGSRGGRTPGASTRATLHTGRSPPARARADVRRCRSTRPRLGDACSR
jgi:penicillin-binding protein A